MSRLCRVELPPLFASRCNYWEICCSFGSLMRHAAETEKPAKLLKLAGFLMEATPGIEPGCADLQSTRVQRHLINGLGANRGALGAQSINGLGGDLQTSRRRLSSHGGA